MTRGPAVAALLAVGLLAAAPAPLEERVKRGPVTAWVRLSPPEPRLGDPLVLELEVRAEPGVEVWMPEFGEALDRFTIVDFAPSEGIDDRGYTVTRQRYTLQASRSGPQRIPPLLVEFVDRRPGRAPAPEDGDAYELLTAPLDFEVAGVLAEGEPLTLRPARDELGPRAGEGGAAWVWLAATIGLFLLAAPFARRAWLARQEREERRSAYETARAELDELLAAPLPSAEEMDPFFVRLSNIVRRYVELRFGLRSPELTTEEFLSVMTSSPDLSRDHQALLGDFLARADLVKFARHVPDAAEVRASLEAAVRFLEETREEAASPPAPVALGSEAARG